MENGGNITLRPLPLGFLNPPTLRPSPSQARSLSRRPPPALCQTAALAVFLINLFIFAAR